MQQWCVVCIDDVRAEGDRSRPGVHCARRQTERDHIPIRGARTDESVQEDGIHGADQDYVSYRVSRRKLWHIGTSTCIAVLDSACHCMSPRWRCNVSVYLRLSITTLTLHFGNIILHTSPWRSSEVTQCDPVSWNVDIIYKATNNNNYYYYYYHYYYYYFRFLCNQPIFRISLQLTPVPKKTFGIADARFLQDGCSFRHQTNSVRALDGC